MLNEFRTRYPNGGLISELLQIDHGKYIVRVSVQIEGVTVATGLAAADTIEGAEDQARIRAISLLNLNPSVISPTQNSHQSETVNASLTLNSVTPNTRQNSQQPEQPETIIAPKTTVTQPKTEKNSKPSLSVAPPIEEIPEPESDLNLELSDTYFYSSEPEEDPEIEEEMSLPLNPQPIPTAKPEPKLEPAPIVASEPMDYSDIIARTNVEMKRLGWTSEQGRDYLIGTYGKRSRQLLDDEQLIEFLQYLEGLPTP